MRPALAPGRLQGVYDRAARRYDRWHALATARSDRRGRRLIVEWCVRRGDAVLDAGGGTGSTAALAVQAVGSAGHVTLVDFSRGMLGQAAAHLRGSGSRSTSLVMADLMQLPFDDGRFDAVLSTYSVCPLASPIGGVAEMYRVLKPGGLLGVAHSTEPGGGLVGWLANRVEDLVWRWPQVSLGCRSVEVLPDLLALGAELVRETRVGVPLWPFRVFAVMKPKSSPTSAA